MSLAGLLRSHATSRVPPRVNWYGSAITLAKIAARYSLLWPKMPPRSRH